MRDPDDMRTNAAVGNIYLKNGDCETARRHFSRAIKRLTTDYTRPSDGEALYLQGVTLKALGLYNEAIDTLYRATWDYAYHSAAYFELAQISCMQGDFEKALHQIEESLSTNIRNNLADSLKASIQRKLEDVTGAKATLASMLLKDPLNFRAINENYLITKASGNVAQAEEVLAGLQKKMRDFNQNYLELAVGYLNDGMPEEAGDVLLRFTGKDPIVYYYLGFIADGKGKKDDAQNYFSKAQELSEDYCFPFRLETLNVLKKAITYNEGDTKAYYYMGNILYDKQPDKAIIYWENAIKNNPNLAMAYRNLGWGYYRNNKDLQKAIPYYEKAIALDHRVALFYTELDQLYELNNSPVETRLKIFEGNQDAVYGRDDAFVRQITVLTLAGKPEKAIEYLEGKQFSYREGTSRVRETIIDAHLTLGLKYYIEKNYEQALQEYLLAQVPDEEAGSARFGNRNIQVDYFIGQAYEALKNNKKAKEHFIQATAVDLSGRPGIMNYYQGLCYLKLKEKAKAEEVFNAMVTTGNDRVNDQSEATGEYFAIFGEREAESTIKSNAYTLRGLGYKGLGEKDKAEEDLSRAVEISLGNLWATMELSM